MWSSASKLNRKDSSIHCSFTVTTVKTAVSSATLSGAKEIPPFLTKYLKYNATTIYTLSLEKRHKSTHTYTYSVAYAYPEDAQSSGWPVPLPEAVWGPVPVSAWLLLIPFSTWLPALTGVWPLTFIFLVIPLPLCVLQRAYQTAGIIIHSELNFQPKGTFYSKCAVLKHSGIHT